MTDLLAPLVEALRHTSEPGAPTTWLATVTGFDATGVLVTFDGESAASTKRYKSTHSVFVGMRVLMTRVGSTWVVNGDVDGGPWTAATLTNGWTNFGTGFQTARYSRVAGIVYIEGLLAPGSNGTVAFTLPAGYRPAAILMKHGNTNSAAASAGRFDIASDGTLTVQGSFSWQSVECDFRAAA